MATAFPQSHHPEKLAELRLATEASGIAPLQDLHTFLHSANMRLVFMFIYKEIG